MKKKALRKNFLRTVYRTLPKFLSILFLVGLGVMVFVGLKITSPIMRRSVENTIQTGNLFDYKISSTYGLLKDDMTIVANLKNLENYEFGYYIDVKDRTKNINLHVENKPEKISTITVISGDDISNSSEILLDERLMEKYKIGDTIKFDNVEKTPIFKDEVKKLKNDTFKVVGFIRSPEVLSESLRGTTENGYLAIVEKTEFDYTNYSFAKVKFSDMNNLKKESSEFEKLNKQKRQEIQKLFEDRVIDVYSVLYNQKKSLLEDSKNKLEEKKDTLRQNENELEKNQQDLESGKSDVRTALINLNYKKQKFLNEIEENRVKLNDAKSKIQKEKSTLESKYESLTLQLQDLIEQKTKIEEAQANLDSNIKPLEESLAKLEQSLSSGLISESEYHLKKNEIENNLKKLKTKYEELSKNLEELNPIIKNLENGIKEIELGKVEISKKETEVQNNISKLSQSYQDGLEKFDEYYAKLNSTKQSIEEGKLKIEEGKNKIEDAKDKINDADKKVAEGDEILSKLLDPIYDIEDGFTYSNAGVVYFAADGIDGVSNVFSVFFYFIAILVALTTMTRTVDENRVQIGTLKALGYSNWDISKQYFYYGLLASLIGGIIGTIFGFKIISPLVYRAYLKSFIFPKVFDNYYLGIVFVGIAIAVFCTAFASYFVCIGSLKEKISLLMRPKAPKDGNSVYLEKIKFIWKELSFLQKVTIRNIFRYKLRLSMTIIGVLGCMALLVLGFGIKDSLDGVSELQYEKYVKYNMSMVYNPMDLQEKLDKLNEDLKSNENIKDFTDVSVNYANLKTDIKFDEKIGIFTVNNYEDFSRFFTLYSGDKKIESLEDGIYINKKISERLGVNKGDNLNFIVNNKEYSSKIADVFENHVGNFIIMNSNTHERVFLKRNVLNSKLLILSNGSQETYDKVSNEIEKNEVVISTSDINDYKKIVEDSSNSVNSIILVIIVCSGFLSIVVLYNLSNINISERKREIATLKVLGFYPKEINSYIYRETFVLTIIGIFIGVFVGKELHIRIMEELSVNSIRFFNKINLVSYIYAALITLVFTFIVYIIVKGILRRVKMIESLKDVE